MKIYEPVRTQTFLVVFWLPSFSFSSGETASEEDDVGLSFLFGGIKTAEHQKNRSYTLTIPSLSS